MLTEMRGQRPQTQPMQNASEQNASELDPTSLAHIRDMIDGAQKATSNPVRKRAEMQVNEVQTKEVGPEAPLVGAQKFSELAPATPKSRKMDQVKRGILSYRPAPKHIALAIFAAVLIFRPWLVFWATVFSLFAMIGIFVVLGYDGFWQKVMKVGRWYGRRYPHRAAKLHGKLDGFAVRWDRVLDYFPDGTVDGLYMPDFGDLATVESRHDAALDRRFADLGNS